MCPEAGCGSLSAVELGNSWQMRKGPFGQNLYTALEPDSTKRQLLPVFKDDSSHQQVGKSSGEMAHVERFFGRLRQKLVRQVRRTRAASESARMLYLTTELFVKWYNEAVPKHRSTALRWSQALEADRFEDQAVTPSCKPVAPAVTLASQPEPAIRIKLGEANATA